MDRQDKKETSLLLIFLIVALCLPIVFDYLWRVDAFSEDFKIFYHPILLFFWQYILYIKLLYVLLIILLAYVNASKITTYTGINKLIYAVVFILTVLPFIYGYSDFPFYNIFLYPVFFLLSSGSLYILMTSLLQNLNNSNEEKRLAKVGTTKSDFEFSFKTDKGNLPMPNPYLGVYIEGPAGSGKSVNIENFLWQACEKDYAMFLYDYEGNPMEKGGAILSSLVYTAIKQMKGERKVKFAFLNFADMTRTVRCNPISPKYVKTQMDIIEVSNVLMKNLNPEWAKKTDFWADNAISLVVGAISRLHKSHPQYSTLPHLVALLLSDSNSLMEYLAEDPEIAPIIRPIYTAYKMGADQQTAGVMSSVQIPLTKLYTPEIFWVLSPPEKQAFDLDITNATNPVAFCIGNNPRQQQATAPLIALISSIVMQQMNQPNRHKSAFVIDEAPTIILPGLEKFPATVRKHKVITMVAVQTFKQFEARYGEREAEIIRDNLSNIMIGKTNSVKTAEHITKLFGKYRTEEESFSTSEDSETVSRSKKEKEFLLLNEVSQQPIGHWTGFMAGVTPPYYHAQFEFFNKEKLTIPQFSLPVLENGQAPNDEVMQSIIKANFKRINQQIADLLEPYNQISTID